MKIPLQKGSGIPLLGLGTWRLAGEECERAIAEAYELGYRHIDTADVYKNHDAVGRAIRKLPRREIFLATKIGFQDLAPAKIAESIPRYLDELQVEYIDLLLIHWPNPELDMADALREMTASKEKRIVRSIGVSNFVRSHLDALGPRHFPIATNQIELHPYLQRRELADCCKKWGIGITAYRPLAKGAFENDPVLTEIGAKHGKSASQTALRWLVQQDIAAIPKASSLKHLRENAEIFDFSLSPKEMERIHALDSGKRFCAPDNLPLFSD